MKSRIRVLSAILSFLMILCSCSSAGNGKTVNIYDDEEIVKTSKALADFFVGSEEGYEDIFSSAEDYAVGFSPYDWSAMALKLSGFETNYDSYLKMLENYVNENYAENGGLSKTKATEWHRIIMVLKSLGANPASFGFDGNGNPIDLVSDGIYNYVNEDLKKQGINGYAYGLIALQTGNYTYENPKYSEEDILKFILENQNEDGGFALVIGKSSEVDVTSIVMIALSRYLDRPEVQNVVDKAVDYLAANQSENGYFGYFGTENCESLAYVINALISVGIDPETEERFNKKGKNLYKLLLDYRLKDGSFEHVIGDKKTDLIATGQALLTMESARNLKEGKNCVYQTLF